MVFYSSVISSWESHQSSTCHLPSHGLPWPSGGVVPPLPSTSNCFRVLWSHPYFNIKEVWFLPIGNKALFFWASHSRRSKMLVVPYREIPSKSFRVTASFLSHPTPIHLGVPSARLSWHELWDPNFWSTCAMGKWTKIHVLSFRRWKQVPACLPRNKKILVWRCLKYLGWKCQPS